MQLIYFLLLRPPGMPLLPPLKKGDWGEDFWGGLAREIPGQTQNRHFDNAEGESRVHEPSLRLGLLFVPQAIMATITGPQAVRRMFPRA